MPNDSLQTELRAVAHEESTASNEDGDDEPWDRYAEYLHETTGLSPRQAEVAALERFGHTPTEIREQWDVGAPTVSKHRSAVADKTDDATRLVRLHDDLLDGVGVAPAEVATTTVDGDQQTHTFTLYVNYAYGHVVADDAPPAASARVILVRESHATETRHSTTTREVSLYDDYDQFVLAGLATRVFPHPMTDCAEAVATLGSVLGGRDPDQLLARRESVYPGIESAYRAIARGESTTESVADTYGLPVEHVSRNVREFTTQTHG